MGEENENPEGIERGDASDLMSILEAASSADTSPEGNASGDTTIQPEAGTSETGTATREQADGTDPAGRQPATDRTPEPRIVAAVRNAREETRREVEAQYAPFKGMDPQQATLGLQLVQEIQANPRKFFEEMAQHLGVDLNPQPQPKVEDIEALPEPDLVSADGQLKTYRAETVQKMLENTAKRVEAQIMKRLDPTLKFTENLQTSQAQQQKMAELSGRVQNVLAEARTLPHFTEENEPAILGILQKMPAAERYRLGPEASLHKAYSLFLKEHIFPSIDQQAEGRVRSNFLKKAAASAGVHPGSTAGDGKKPKLQGVDDLAAHMERLAGG